MSDKKKLKEYVFEFDICGKAQCVVHAHDDEEAVKKIAQGEHIEDELIEWDYDRPYGFYKTCENYPDEVMTYCASVDEIDEGLE